MASEYELWTDYPYDTESVMVRVSSDPESLAELAEKLMTQGHISHWFIIEKRTAISFHLHRMMGQ